MTTISTALQGPHARGWSWLSTVRPPAPVAAS